MQRPSRLLLLTSFWAMSAAATPVRAARAADQSLVLVLSGASNHHWEFTSAELARMLRESGLFRVETSADPAAALARADLAAIDAFVLDYNGPRWGSEAESAFLEAVRAGAGVVVVHAADNAFPGWKEYEELVGHCWREGLSGHGRVHPFDVEIVDREHPVTRGLADIPAHPDELYHALVAAPGAKHRVLARAQSSVESGGTGQAEPVVFAGEFGAGRVFHTALGHVWRGSVSSRDSYGDARFRDLVVRGTQWAATGEVRTQAAQPNALSETERALGWQLLFDGQTARGWRGFRLAGFPEQGWEVRDGCLVVTGGSGVDLISEQAFGDFELDLEFQVTEDANSGVMYRVTEDADATWYSGPEFQVLDDAALGEFPDHKHSVGGLYDLVPPPLKVVRPVGEWNRARITVDGWKVEHRLNGFVTVATDLAAPEGLRLIAASKFAKMEGFAKAARGHIALQDHGDLVRFRSIKLLDRSAHRGQALFDGRDLAGWEAPAGGAAGAVWSADDGILIGKPGGTLITEQDFTSFILRLEWRLNPASGGAGGGVQVRVADGRGLEVELAPGRAGAFQTRGEFTLDPRAGATQANEREPGSWNALALVVEGGEVAAWINGELVNRASGVPEVPGRIALESGGAEIHFRDVYVEPL